jgi:hypothetical protein
MSFTNEYGSTKDRWQSWKRRKKADQRRRKAVKTKLKRMKRRSSSAGSFSLAILLKISATSATAS